MALPLWKDITEITPKLTYGINRFFNSNSCYVHKTFGKKGLKKMHISAVIFTTA